MIKLFLICFGCCGSSPKKTKNIEQKEKPQLSVQLNVSKIQEESNKGNTADQVIHPIVVIVPESSEDTYDLDLTRSHDLTESGENIRQYSPMTENFSEEDMFQKMKIGDNIPTIMVIDSNKSENIGADHQGTEHSFPVTIIQGIQLEAIHTELPNSYQEVQPTSSNENSGVKTKLEKKSNSAGTAPQLPVYKSVQEMTKRKRFSIKLPRKSSSFKFSSKENGNSNHSRSLSKDRSVQQLFQETGLTVQQIIDGYHYCNHHSGRLVDVNLDEGTCILEEKNGKRNSVSIETLKCCVYELSSIEEGVQKESNNE